MPKPGLMFVASKPTKISEEQFNKWYNEEHLPDVLDFMKRSGLEPLGLRYKNVNTESTRPYLALYPTSDAQWIVSPEQEANVQKLRHSKMLGGTDFFSVIDFDLRPYEKIQTFEGYGHASKSGNERGQTLVCVAMDPGEAGEQDFEDWYRKQHLDMLSMCRGYRRTTRYKRMDGQEPRYLALHEYACSPDELPAEQIKQVTATEWTQKILAEAKIFERDVFELIEVQGEIKAKL